MAVALMFHMEHKLLKRKCFWDAFYMLGFVEHSVYVYVNIRLKGFLMLKLAYKNDIEKRISIDLKNPNIRHLLLICL